MKPVIDHIHVTVSDLECAEKFYDKLMPLLGFDLVNKEHDTVPEHEYSVVEYHHGNFSFGIVSPRPAYKDEQISRRKPGALHHLAFHADSRTEVDLSLIHISEPTRLGMISYAVFCLKKKKQKTKIKNKN